MAQARRGSRLRECGSNTTPILRRGAWASGVEGDDLLRRQGLAPAATSKAGSDGTPTRDLRRDRAVRGKGLQPATTGITGCSRRFLDERTGCDRLPPGTARVAYVWSEPCLLRQHRRRRRRHGVAVVFAAGASIVVISSAASAPLRGAVARKRSISATTRSGSSNQGKWPASGMRTTRTFGLPAAIASHALSAFSVMNTSSSPRRNK